MSASVRKPPARAPGARSSERLLYCGLPAPGADYAVTVDGVRAPLCCRGCEAVARAILDAGLATTTATAPGRAAGARLVPEFLRDAAVTIIPRCSEVSCAARVSTGAGGADSGRHRVRRLRG